MSESVQRYSNIEFPRYRFIPGENPHPTENPLGHSFGKKEPNVKALVFDDWNRNEVYLFGVDLYNYGYWWESHEAWESLWRIAPRGHVSREYLQGLIKISGAFLKWHLRKQKGVEYLYVGAMEHLLKVAGGCPVCMGLNVDDYVQKLEKHFKPVLMEYSWRDPYNNYPFIILNFLDEMEDLNYDSRAEYEGFGVFSKEYTG